MPNGKIVTVGSDPVIRLWKLQSLVNDWIDRYGADAVFTTDAGHNNVELMVDDRVATKRKNLGHGGTL